MGFFQDLKQDLSQTVTDMNVDEPVGDIGLDADMSASSEDLFGSVAEGDFEDLEAMLEKEAAALSEEPVVLSEDTVSEAVSEDLSETQQTDVAEKEPEVAPEADMPIIEETATDAGADVPVEEEKNEISEADAEMEMEELLNEVEQNIEEQTLDVAPQEEAQPGLEPSVAASTDTAVITAGMNITGDVTSSGNMDLIGNITGNIEILGKLNVTGGITGNSSAAEIYAESAQINGEIKSKGSVKIGQSSVVIGNIFATSAVIAGAVKGDIDVHGPVILDTSAIVMGNIKSKSVQINNGAVIEGMCSQCYADVSPTSFFNDVKKNRKQQ